MYFRIFCYQSQRQAPQAGDYFAAFTQASACELADNERMHSNQVLLQQIPEFRDSNAEMVHPDRSVDQNHFSGCGRLRGGVVNLGMLPPSAASLRAAFLAINSRKPACTNAVFSSMPVNSRASRTNSSSKINVVLIL